MQKLLAMADDVSSPHEAAIAARQAKHLMQRYEIDNAELLTKGLDRDSFTSETVGAPFRRSTKWVEFLTVDIARYTDTITRFSYKNNQRYNAFLGEISDVKMAGYLFFYFVNTIKRLCTERKLSRLRSKNSYYIAAVGAVGENLRALKKVDKEETNANDKAMILVNKKLKLRGEIFGQPDYVTAKARDNIDLSAVRMGYQDGKGISIRPGVESQQTAGRLLAP
ncbi:MAG: DUF2786 domain-containing protein [Thiotrichales bacterium]|nr:DUF2786 domain-containing protein [Thiotrichales bacterium]